ncbi:NAD(+) synthase [Mycoplasma sp. SG1]|uniref:NAD(+) synthase n=1 Tax=Mycoplasma sp. SG1 TaxID=2810348 RepID=UPI002024E29B|nr:NAD(+) synthase [Mycoplasma sp. SG1]URM53111.1 NAD(+) synthase [Mycoplasma sp. SG1]
MKNLLNKLTTLSTLEINKLDKYSLYLKDYLAKNLIQSKMNGFIVSISGGVDSAFIALFLNKYFKDQTYFIYQPSKNISNLTTESIKALQDKIDNKQKIFTIEIENISKTIINQFKKSGFNFKTKTILNIFPRIRMTNIYTLANELNLLVVGTSNRSEWELGYFTKHGDGAADLFPIIHLSKVQVLYLAKKYNVPKIILEREPTAELFSGQTDEKDLGFSYLELENYFNQKEIKIESYNKIKALIKLNKHKKNLNFPQDLNEFTNN